MHHNFIDPQTIQTIVQADGRAFQLALAVAVAYSLALPSSPVEAPLAFFDDTLREAAGDIIGIYNEVRPAGIAEAVENTKAIWNARYAVCHGGAAAAVAMGAGMQSSALTIFGIAYCVPAPLLQELQERAEAIQPVLAAITATLRRGNTVQAVQDASQG